jgi:hypothetical protein
MSEIQIQAASFQWVYNNYPPLRGCFFAVPNGGWRNKAEASQLKASGVIAGIPDMLLVYAGKVYAWEFKTPDGVLSDAQHRIHGAWRSQGILVQIARSFEDFKVQFLNIVK